MNEQPEPDQSQTPGVNVEQVPAQHEVTPETEPAAEPETAPEE